MTFSLIRKPCVSLMGTSSTDKLREPREHFPLFSANGILRPVNGVWRRWKRGGSGYNRPAAQAQQ